MSEYRRAWLRSRVAARAGGIAAVLVAGTTATAFAAFNNTVTGGPMSVTTAALTAPTALSASNPCSSATTISSSLSWTASTATATSGYSILRSTSSGGPFSSVGTVSGINTTTYTDTITHGSVADSIYVAVKSANGMDVVSMSSNTKTANSGGANLKNPVAIAVTPDGTTAYLVNSGAHTVTPVTLSNDSAGTQITVGAQNPTGIAITPDGTTAWVADGTGNVVTPVTVSTNTAGSQVNVGFNATAIAITPDGKTAWIAGQTQVVSLNLSTLTLGTTYSQAGADFQALAITPDGTTAYLVDASGAKKIWPLTLSTGTFGTGIALTFTPQAIAISPDGKTAWVDGQTDIAPITLSSSTVGSLVNIGGANFQGIAISPNGCWVYGADSSGSNRLVPVNAGTDTAGTSITVDTSPEDIAVAYPPATYYYEVEGTRNNWTSPVSGQASLVFGQPAHSS